MHNILIYGCGHMGKAVLFPLQKMYGYNVLGYIDRNKELSDCYFDIPILKGELSGYLNLAYDLVLISLNDLSECRKIKATLEENGFSSEKIKFMCFDPEYIELFSDQRTNFIKDYALWCEQKQIQGNVAECGVFTGDSAKFINRYFENRKMYLFDTFEGFEEIDLNYEINEIKEGFNSVFFDKGRFKETSLDIVMAKMTSLENVVVRKGYFPETAEGIDDTFCFVNLDMDLYLPMLAGLHFFWERMEKGGCILLHDYFHQGLKGVEKAVADFEEEIGYELTKIPIGDHISLAIIK